MVNEMLPNLRKLGGCKPKATELRFHESYIPEPNSGCWLWLGVERGDNGYGGIKVDGAHVPAHRYSWTLHCGPIPDGMLVLHQCDTPACVNPDHLFIGTHQDNEDDKVSKGRQASGERLRLAQHENRPRGIRNGKAKLTQALAEEIRASDLTQRAIAKKYGVSQGTIWSIRKRMTWNG